MDEASRLVSELQHKLTELDHKVWKYRQEMASEFTKYAEDLLRDVPKDVSDTVSRAIAQDVEGYKSLNPSSPDAIESCETGTSIVGNGLDKAASSSYPRVVKTASNYREDPDSPRSSHEREQEFQGVFTPSYLPLLDSTSRNERRPSSDQLSPALDNKGKGREMEIFRVDASTDTRSLAPSPELTRPPTPKRKNTDEASVASDHSDGPVRRSALRRSSSSSKPQSPRRVRFDVAGTEVLPTASPLPDESVIGGDLLPRSVGLGDASEDEPGAEQIEDIDCLPPGKRVSSSQKLRALSRGPWEDDGTQWTTVTAPPDGSASVAMASGIEPDSSEEDLQIMSIRSEQTRGPVEIQGSSPAARKPAEEISKAKEDAVDAAETPSDDEMLDMPPLRRSQKSEAATILSPIDKSNIDDNKSPTASTRTPSKPWFSLDSLESFKVNQDSGDDDFRFDDDLDDLFHFDENANEQRSPPEEDHGDSDLDSPVSPQAEKGRAGLEAYSASPARDIPLRSAAKPVSPSAKGVVGSYKGHPFSMPIVSEEIHAKAASLGALNSFVGSVNGRSGFDESDIQSFRGSLKGSGGTGSFSGAPKSMTERMMMDDLLEGEETTKPS